LMMVGIAPHVKSIIHKYEAQIKRGNIFKENWFYALVWLALLVWGAIELLA